jgi:aspartate/methionine/tyrosine aminotransferase
MALSKRTGPLLVPSPLYESFARALGNVYHPKQNPNGIISLGIAENTVMYDDLAEFLDENLKITPDIMGYGAAAPGLPGLYEGLLKLYNAPPFNPVDPVKREQLYFTSGCTALLDQLFYALCDEGDGVLLGKPMYGGFVNDMQTRARAKLIAVSLKGIDAFSKDAVKRYEEEYLKARQDGINPRVLVLCTPHNPLGQ